ncbi:competence/damage-inducible protein A [Sphingobacterium sp. lm-10]|uniref:competence/damage-inducible protein A n=1 Tax=Sphingobacterium sp. lm-10 TaxID=2944904 RepID=UPI0020210B00|nr:competence/damage-inducible protein A [Sphingobacterium sp. lm-10]MCL7987945.1 competence/damage-inducible protein A [Sphingobacterium sp. lm-10]
MATKIEIITIGDEILQGQIIDSNSAWIAQQLLLLNLGVVQITTIADREEAIVEAFDQAKQRADVILVTGGLGPTKDDITKHTAAEYFGTQLVRDEQVLAHVKAIFEQRKREMLAINEMQADVFEGGDVLFNELGTAPGLWYDYEGKSFAFMPGVPFEMKHIMSVQVLPRLARIANQGHIVNMYILTAGLGESYVAESIKDIESDLPKHIRLAYLPKLGIVRLRLTGTSMDANALRAEMEVFATRIKERVNDHFVSFGDMDLEGAILPLMNSNGYTLATAESCTGGMIASRITAIPGAGDVFKGSVVSYTNEIKNKLLGVSEQDLEEFGAVSEQVVSAMATGAIKIFDVDFALATSGFAGPDGGSEDTPVGTIWIALATKTKVYTQQFHFHNDRNINIERATTHSFLLLWHQLRAALSIE